MTQIERIKSLITSLPNKDRGFAEMFLKQRNFESLWELVISDIYKVRKHPESYPESDLSDMNVLKAELMSYMDQLCLLDDEDLEEEDDFIIDSYEEY